MESIAACKFCGQTFFCDAESQAERDEYAFNKCKCDGAVHARIRAKHIKDATAELNDVFAYRFYNDEEIEGSNEMYADIKRHIEQLIPFMVDLDLLKADFYVSGLGKITLSVNSDSVIKIKRTVSSSIERRA
ncbi:MAG: hypothetical protein NC122_10655, partial [Faecalibacterium sp.]|nr:hypothetical protein [Ruminococcus sp.]MCM1393178.1 hypothetical protein [Ruminococcus sp.]MCM1486650.1 hypothetical protein [Faecalibacterium sp.]